MGIPFRDEYVDDYSSLIRGLEQLKSVTITSEEGRAVSIALTELQTSFLWFNEFVRVYENR